jgi:hypothetical protein
MTRWRRLPEAAQEARCDPVRLLLVVDRPEQGPRVAALYEERAALGIVRKKPHRAAAVPEREGVRLVLALRLRKVELDDRAGTVRQRSGDDERDMCILEGHAQGDRPLLRALRDETGQALEPGRAARPGRPALERGGDLQRRARQSRSPSCQWGRRGASACSERSTE